MPRTGNKEKEKEKDSAQGDEVSNKDLRDIFSSLIQKLENSMSERLATLEKKLEETRTTVKEEIIEMKVALQNQDDRLTELEKIDKEIVQPQSERVSQLETSLRQLQDHITYLEARSRKYNLLFYGIARVENEDVSAVILNFLRQKLGMLSVDDILIQNCHRIPKNPNNNYNKPGAPDAIIAKLVRMEDRNQILIHAKNATLPQGYAVRTDLPGHLKKKRGKLAQKAYELRKDGMKTRIREVKDDVILEYRRKDEKEWIKFCDPE